jgi:hypothetical protein
MGLCRTDHINRLITLSVITLSGFHCTYPLWVFNDELRGKLRSHWNLLYSKEVFMAKLHSKVTILLYSVFFWFNFMFLLFLWIEMKFREAYCSKSLTSNRFVKNIEISPIQSIIIAKKGILIFFMKSSFFLFCCCCRGVIVVLKRSIG